jgi:bacteriorhodopsin
MQERALFQVASRREYSKKWLVAQPRLLLQLKIVSGNDTETIQHAIVPSEPREQ